MKKLIWGLLLQYQIFHTYIINIAWQILRRITYEILGVKGLIFLVLNYPCFLFSLFLYLSRRLTWLVVLLWLAWFNSLPKTTTKRYWLELALSPGNEKYITKKIISIIFNFKYPLLWDNMKCPFSTLNNDQRLVTVSFSIITSVSLFITTPSVFEDIFLIDFVITEDFLLRWPVLLVGTSPSMSSIICSRNAWSSVSMGTTEMSRTARNWPQLFKCSFSRRKKFQIKRLKHRNLRKTLPWSRHLIVREFWKNSFHLSNF